jgi:hypothetical protein
MAEVRIEWHGKEILKDLTLTMTQRMKLAVELVKSNVVRNISRPVTKGTGPRGGRVITDRSKPGEFPKADTTLLMKSIFGEVKVDRANGNIDGFIGTPLDYGVILELRMNRSFLKRTLDEEQERIKKVLGKSWKGGRSGSGGSGRKRNAKGQFI